MLRPQLHQHYQTSTPVFLFPKPFFHGNSHTRLPVFPKSSAKTKAVRARNKAGKIKATATEIKDEKCIWQSTKVKVLVTVKKPKVALWHYGIGITLVSSGSEKMKVSGYAENKDEEEQESYLPSETPDGLKQAREEELENLRGNGKGERRKGERIYDYDVYNDLGDPDKCDQLKRPVLGGEKFPYPRRCRTGRPKCETDKESESRSSNIAFDSVYVPHDEEFSEVKGSDFTAETYRLKEIIDSQPEFPNFPAIDSLFKEGIKLHSPSPTFKDEDCLVFDTPQTIKKDKFFWLRDEEFGRQTLAGVNPMSIQLIRELPLKSKLDPDVYGPPESAITEKMIEEEIIEFMTVEEAVKEKKLFMLDYHDLFLPYVNKVCQLQNTTLYGSRTVFFLTPENVLRPLAIELVQPPMERKPQWKKVFRPASWHSTDYSLWKLAKAHVLAHDSGYHQLISHWLRTHCCAEPYIIAANRQLSAMHPIYRLLHPHFRYTMEMNALGRQNLINAGGVIESTFSPEKYCLEMSSMIYKEQWRFDHQGLPEDLISRGMAFKDCNEPHGLKLTIEDYPFASDGLILWDAIKTWVTDYVNHYYRDSTTVSDDNELQAFWTEVRTVGHGDKKDKPWWPELKTTDDLINIITTIMWTASGLHAAVNFGQYAYSGYMPNRPSLTRRKIPTEEDSDWKVFTDTPEKVLLATLPSQSQAATLMISLHALSYHSQDEEYLGKEMEISWGEEPEIKAAFEKFQKSLSDLEKIIDDRNADPKLRNRNGTGLIPYELLKPSSDFGVTGKGVPYSISI
ncbi:Lipoxygenase 2 chloroplastic [Euphorbia peplus]|nr:Lipoxygenase 2 chloroplastic [Euphorbia peplus]